MEQLEYTICVKVTYFQKTRQIVFSYIIFRYLKVFSDWVLCRVNQSEVSNPKFKKKSKFESF